MTIESRIRSETPLDASAIRHVHEAAFGGGAEALLAELLRKSASFLPDLALVAEVDGEVVGHVLFSRAAIEGLPDEKGMLVLGPIGVLPPQQRRGIGCALIQEGLRRAARMGFRGVALIGHPTYYPRLGFQPGTRFGLRSTYDVPDDLFMARPLSPGSLDGLSGTVLYPSEFAGL
jgi:putative acetyltransferase